MINQEKIHDQCHNKNPKKRIKALNQLRYNFSSLADKQQAWNDLLRLNNDENSAVRYRASYVLGSSFSQVPNKQQAWNDLLRLNNDENSAVRYSAYYVLGSSFSQVPDKQQAWNDLIRLISDQDDGVKVAAIQAISCVFSDVPDKQQACNDLIRLISDQDDGVKATAFQAIDNIFSQVPDKQQACNDLIRLISDQDDGVKAAAFQAIDNIFSQVPDKQQAWNDLLRLTTDEDSAVRYSASCVLGSSFSQVPNKQQAWNDLLRLTNDEDSLVRYRASCVLGSSFTQTPDKQQAWNDLYKLATHKDRDVRALANHSLGKFSIFKASQAEKEKDYKQELEKAITFFEKATQESLNKYLSPAKFCLPFYRSFHTIVFKKQEGKEEVDKYLAEAKDAIGSSKNKELLFEAVNNLANALKEVQNIENLNFDVKKDELSFYRQYCDRAAELMKNTEESAPFVTTAMRKGLPILDRNLKELLEEIQRKAKIACNESKGTEVEEIACTINIEVQKWEIGNQDYMTSNVENLMFTLEALVPKMPDYQPLLAKIKQIGEEKDVVKQYGFLISVISSLHEISKNLEASNSKKTFSKKITNSVMASLGAASALAALSYSICGIYNLENQHRISTEVFTVSFLFSLIVFFVVVESNYEKLKL